jgi:hypothetical protein
VLGLISWLKKDAKYVKEVNIDMNLSFFFLIQPYILKTALDLLSCRTVNSEELLVSEMAIHCWTEKHSHYALSIAVPSLVIWVLILPSCVFFVLFKANRSLTWADKTKYVKHLMLGVKPDFYWWELVLFLRKSLLLAASSLLLQFDRETQLITGALVAIIATSMQFVFNPFVLRAINIYDFCSLVSATYFLSMSYFIQSNGSASSTDAFMTVVVYSLLLAMLLLTFFFLRHMLSPTHRKHISQIMDTQSWTADRKGKVLIGDQYQVEQEHFIEVTSRTPQLIFVPHNSMELIASFNSVS